MSDDKDRECDMNSPSKVIQFSSNEVHRIFQEISGINEKLTTLVRIEEKVLNLTELHTNLRIRLENVESRERKNERDMSFALQQAREFNKIKDSIITNVATNTANTANTKSILQTGIHWVGAITSAIVIAAILNNNEPKTQVTRDDHKESPKMRLG